MCPNNYSKYRINLDSYLLKKNKYTGLTLIFKIFFTVGGGKILFILNPKSGPGKAKEIFREQVLPVLIEAEVEYDLHVTKAQNDAR